MNTLKFLKLKYLIFAVMFFFASTASAVTVRVVEGGTVGLTTGYFAGIVTLDIDGVQYPAMSIDWYYGANANPGWQIDYAPWEGVLYTQDDILAGAGVIFAPEKYSLASKFFLDGLLGYVTSDALWAASYNEMVWNTLDGIGLWNYSNEEYPEAGSGITLYDVYLSEIAGGLDPKVSYDFMGILQTPIWSTREFAILKEVPSIPIPPAMWLFGSGLLGLVGIARRKKS